VKDPLYKTPRLVSLAIVLMLSACGGSAGRPAQSAAAESGNESSSLPASMSPGANTLSDSNAQPSTMPAPAAKTGNSVDNGPSSSGKSAPELQLRSTNAIELSTRDCQGACLALQSLERSVAQVCTLEKPKCSALKDLAFRTRSKVLASCVCTTLPSP
jgi:hypothetical protein